MISGNVIKPFQRLVGLWSQLQEIGIAIERLCDVIEAEPEEDRESSRQSIGRLQGYVISKPGAKLAKVQHYYLNQQQIVTISA